jgi:hypothetical protein
MRTPTARADIRDDLVVALVCPECLKIIGFGDAVETVARYLRRRSALNGRRSVGSHSERRRVSVHQTLSQTELAAPPANAELEAEVDRMIANATRIRPK